MSAVQDLKKIQKELAQLTALEGFEDWVIVDHDKIIKRTPKDIKIEVGDKDIWLPKSQIKIIKEGVGKNTILARKWLVRDKKLKILGTERLPMVTESEREQLIKKGRTLINSMVSKMESIVDKTVDLKPYIDEYKKAAKILRAQELKIGINPKDLTEIKDLQSGIKKDFKKKLKDTPAVSEYLFANGIDSTDKGSETIYQISKQLKDIESNKELSKTQKKELKQKTVQSVQSLFNPRITILQLKEYPEDVQRKYKSLYDKDLKSAHDAIARRIEWGFRQGFSPNKVQKISKHLVDRHFPNGRVVIQKEKNGKVTTWSQDAVNYTANWVHYGSRRFASEGTIDACIQTGADIVRYVKGTNADHTEICERLSSGGMNGYYSLSGKSKKYTKLPLAPPASPPPHPCHSRLVVAPRSMQEIILQPLKTKKEIQKEKNKVQKEVFKEAPKPPKIPKARTTSKPAASPLQNFKSFKNKKEINEYVAKDDISFKKWRKSLSAEEIDSLDGYTAERYEIINKYLRNPESISSGSRQSVANETKGVLDALKKHKLQEGITVHRGFSDPSFINLYKEKGKDGLIGSTYNDKAVLSTSLDKSIANKFLTESLKDKDVGFLATIRVPKGISAGYMGKIGNQKGLSGIAESEVLLDADQKMKVVDVIEKKKNGKTTIELIMEVIL